MPDLPADTRDEAERLTRLARQAVDEGAVATYRDQRAALLDEHDYEARIREEDTGDVLVCYPSEWVEDGVIRPDRVEDTDRGVEIRLSGPGDPDEWNEVEEQNRAVVEAVRDEHGDAHAATARALADFMGNHYAKPIAEATPAELAEFREEYFPRNVWPTEKQRALLEDSVQLAVEEAERL
ncbi:DUF7108 family protein [Haloarcula sediminis]|uniref:DUF7108 family protein n=1 Tax=Haloarcula sediminis TaxID=3111777 RepID=UPI002D7A36A1|nr:rnhA operon protein [Haloarcula sp. CK38]